MDPTTLMLGCLLLAFMGKNAATDGIALSKGKEAPSLEKHRMRHRDKKPTTKSGKAKGPVGSYLAKVADNTSHELKARADHKHARRRAWYDETAGERDEAWRERQRKKLENRKAARDRFFARRGIIQPIATTGPDAAAEQTTTQVDPAPPEATTDQEAGDQQAGDADRPAPQPEGTRQAGEEHKEKGAQQRGEEQAAQASPTASDPAGEAGPANDQQPGASAGDPSATGTDTSTGGATVYQAAADQMHAAAERIEQYREEFAVLAESMSGQGWGAEVHGAIREMDADLAAAAGAYRDTATQMRQQGDNVANSYDQAPWAPDHESALA